MEPNIKIVLPNQYIYGTPHTVDGVLFVKVEFSNIMVNEPYISCSSLHLSNNGYNNISSETLIKETVDNGILTMRGILKIPNLQDVVVDNITISVYDLECLYEETFKIDIVGVVSADPVTETVHKDSSVKSNKVENLEYVPNKENLAEMFYRGNTPHLVVADDLYYKEFTKHEHTVMELVDILANKSTCQRAKMGAVIVIDDGIFITGYNGTLKGFPNNCDDISLVCTVCNIVVDPSDYNEGDQHCKKGYIEKRPKSNTNVVHAEVNSIYKAAKYGICIKDRPMYMTTSPCVNCANAIVQAGISKVIYKHDHDDLRGIDTLRKAGIEVIKYING